MPHRDSDAIVVCIGNELVADDAVGFEVFRGLAGLAARLEYCGTCGIDLVPLLSGEKLLVVVDAVELGAPAGTLHVLPWEELPAAGSSISAHGVGLREAIEIGRLLYPEQMPEKVVLVGVEGRCFNRPREYMTGEVAEAIAPAVEKVRELVREAGR